jgi:hypothetical protein
MRSQSSGGDTLRRIFEEEHPDADGAWRLTTSAGLGESTGASVPAAFVDTEEWNGTSAYQFTLDDDLPERGPYFLRAEGDAGTEQAIRRRLRNIAALETRTDLSDSLEDPWEQRRTSRQVIDDDDVHLQGLDVPKQNALQSLWSTLPTFFVVGPPGVGKTKLATEVLRRVFEADQSARILISAQGHDALENLQEQIAKTLVTAGLTDLIVVRSTTPERRMTNDQEVHRLVQRHLAGMASSPLTLSSPAVLRQKIAALAEASGTFEQSRGSIGREDRAGLSTFSSTILDSANIMLSTANSSDIERLVEAKGQFDWVIVEEAAKATGIELVGPLLLSSRRLLIGDHNQLPPMEAERLKKILVSPQLLKKALDIVQLQLGSVLREADFAELRALQLDPMLLKRAADLAAQLAEPFRTFAEADSGRARKNPTHRPISATLTLQHRMDPAIAEVVSRAFYDGQLQTESGWAQVAAAGPPPFECRAPLSAAPIVVVNFPHVSSTGKGDPLESGKPRWHNAAEIDAVAAVLTHLRANDGKKKPTLAILSPYAAQVERIRRRLIQRAPATLTGFSPIRPGADFVGTVDAFQGSEADIVIVSLVRNNARVGGKALGFLSDRRRMNVLLSRARWKLVLIGSLEFLREAASGVNPSAGPHALFFLTEAIRTIEGLALQKRGDMPLASIVPARTLLANR